MMQEVELQEMPSGNEPNRAATTWSVVRVSTRPSLLDTDFGGEILDIVYPTTTCMFFVIFLVRLLKLGEQDFSQNPSLGQAYYHEQEDDSTSEKLEGAAINGAIFVACITVATFGIFLLFKYNCSKVIWVIMGTSGVSVFFLFGYNIILRVLQVAEINLDQISFFLIMWNFCVVGVVSVFFWPCPLTLKQGNLICIATATAYIFCRLPEWSTFLLLISLALYDLGAVLLPVGPLKILVELAVERDESIPALVYEARGAKVQAPFNSPVNYGAPSPPPVVTVPTELDLDGDDEPLLSREEFDSLGGSAQAGGAGQPTQQEVSGRMRQEGIKLGLGDFIFYSVLVGRAAMFDMVAAFATYLAIVAGLVMTLMLLAVFQKALPALPISIFSGIGFYLLGRLVLDPFVIGVSSNLMYF